MKKLILFLIPFLITGCTINYELDINDDLSVTENIKVLEDASYFNREASADDTYKKIVDIGMNENGYLRYDYIKENNLYGGKAIRNYKSLEDFVNEAASYKKLFSGLDLSINENIVTLKSVGEFNVQEVSFNSEEFPDVRIPEDVYFSIKVPFKVISHNADRVDNNYNIYYWDIRESTTKDKNIEITFDTKQKHTSIKKLLDKIDYTIVLIIGIIIIAGYFLNSIIKKNDENNRI